MSIHFPLYHVNAFTQHLFSGNPAMVCLLHDWLPDPVLQKIAQENNLPVTAFLVAQANQFSIRWITPEGELDLCGHGSLAAGYVIFNKLKPQSQCVTLSSRSTQFQVTRVGEQIALNFPVKGIESVDLPEIIEGLGKAPIEIYQHQKERCLVVYEAAEIVQQLRPNFERLQRIPHRGIVVTAPGEEGIDFVSRTFYPRKGVPEDAVTGASHCLLAPYWSTKLNKTNLHALQLSARGGELFCHCVRDSVQLSGDAVLYAEGRASITL